MSKKNTSGIPDTAQEEPSADEMRDAAPAESSESSTALAEPNGAEVGPNMSDFRNSLQDMDTKILNMIQDQSKIQGNKGSILLNREFELVNRDGKINCIVVAATKGWQEDVPYKQREANKPISTYDEHKASALAKTSNWPVIEFAVMYLLFPEPDDVADDVKDAFEYRIGDKYYAFGRLHVDKKAYRLTYKALATWLRFNKPPEEGPRDGIRIFSNQWKLSVNVEVSGMDTFYSPQLSATRTETPTDVLKFIPEMLGENA